MKISKQMALCIIGLLFVSLVARAQRTIAFHQDNNRVVLVTGAASGIGKATAIKFQQEGYTVYATDIDTTHWHDVETAGCRTLFLDVTDEASIQRAFQTIRKESGGVDILVNNAGYGQNGVIEELSLDDIRYQFEVNVFGLLRMSQMAVPFMRQQGQGYVINIGSVGGDFTTPGASAYHASKYAVESFSDGLRGELYPFGIHVVLVKPGGVDTNFANNAEKYYPEPMKGDPYHEFRKKFTAMTSTILDPEESSYPILKASDVADQVYKAATDKKPKTRYRVGVTARMMPMVTSLKSDRGMTKMMLKQIGVYQQQKEKRKDVQSSYPTISTND